LDLDENVTVHKEWL